MNITVKKPTIPAGGLAALHEVELTKARQSKLDALMAEARGQPVWKRRKGAEARELLALEQIAPRMHIDYLDLTEALRAVVFLRTPVAGRPKENGELPLADMAVLGIEYRQEFLTQPTPGYSYVQILSPTDLFYPNVVSRPPPMGQPLCLGVQLPPGIRLRELIVMSYGALTMQAFNVKVMEINGVFNVEAARWWDQNLARVPLSKVPFLGTDDLDQDYKEQPRGNGN
jgi:hypothetical protein